MPLLLYKHIDLLFVSYHLFEVFLFLDFFDSMIRNRDSTGSVPLTIERMRYGSIAVYLPLENSICDCRS